MTRPHLESWDMDILARTIWGEARSEPREGRIAVAHVAFNRLYDTRWPNEADMAGVCLQSLQFSCWNTTDPNRTMMARLSMADPMLQECMAIAWAAFVGLVPDPTKGANHYLNPRAVKRLPDWANGDKRTVTIGAHEFFRL